MELAMFEKRIYVEIVITARKYSGPREVIWLISKTVMIKLIKNLAEIMQSR